MPGFRSFSNLINQLSLKTVLSNRWTILGWSGSIASTINCICLMHWRAHWSSFFPPSGPFNQVSKRWSMVVVMLSMITGLFPLLTASPKSPTLLVASIISSGSGNSSSKLHGLSGTGKSSQSAYSSAEVVGHKSPFSSSQFPDDFNQDEDIDGSFSRELYWHSSWLRCW